MTMDKIMESYLAIEDATAELADYFAVFGDRTRLKILCLLSISELCVGDIAFALCLNQSTVSHQLSTLKERRIINCFKAGKHTYYYISDKRIEKLLLQAVIASERD